MLRPEVELRDYQQEGVSYMLAHNYVLNSDEQGLGKTLQSIAVQQSGDYKTLVVCPATVKYNWLEEFKKFTDETDVIVGFKKAKINIINYEQLYRASELFREADLIICDECHYVKTFYDFSKKEKGSQRADYVHRMVSKYKPERLILLSGTPIKNRVPDFYSILKLLSYTPIENNGRNIAGKFRNFHSFCSYFTNKKQFTMRMRGKRGGEFNKTITKYEGVRNETELQAFLKHKYIRRVAKNVLSLPPVTYKDVYVSYKKDTALGIAWLDHCSGKAFDVSAKRDSAIHSANFTAEYIKDLLSSGESPIVVFSDHPEALKIIASKLPKAKAGFITGEQTDMKKRQETINQFQKGSLDLILCSYGAAATGINLTASRNMVLNDESWDAAALSQAVKRIDRIGQTRKCVIHRVLGSPTSQKISKQLAKKNADISKII